MKKLKKTSRFKKEFKTCLKQGKDERKFSKILELLFIGRNLPIKYRDHKLIGEFSGSRELHIEPDWLLIYKITKTELILERTGSHSDLFKN